MSAKTANNNLCIFCRFMHSSRLRHQYGIFGVKSQTSFSRNAIRAGSEEGRLFSLAIFVPTALFAPDSQPTRPWHENERPRWLRDTERVWARDRECTIDIQYTIFVQCSPRIGLRLSIITFCLIRK